METLLQQNVANIRQVTEALAEANADYELKQAEYRELLHKINLAEIAKIEAHNLAVNLKQVLNMHLAQTQQMVSAKQKELNPPIHFDPTPVAKRGDTPY